MEVEGSDRMLDGCWQGAGRRKGRHGSGGGTQAWEAIGGGVAWHDVEVASSTAWAQRLAQIEGGEAVRCSRSGIDGSHSGGPWIGGRSIEVVGLLDWPIRWGDGRIGDSGGRDQVRAREGGGGGCTWMGRMVNRRGIRRSHGWEEIGRVEGGMGGRSHRRRWRVGRGLRTVGWGSGYGEPPEEWEVGSCAEDGAMETRAATGNRAWRPCGGLDQGRVDVAGAWRWSVVMILVAGGRRGAGAWRRKVRWLGFGKKEGSQGIRK